jgi:parallel beta-helix repeat protein
MRLLLLTAPLFCAAISAQARTLVVHAGDSIRTAIAHANPGDRIEVLPGVYKEGGSTDLNALTITIDGIQLIGHSTPGNPVILENAGAQGYGVWVSPPNSVGPGPQSHNETPPCGYDGSTIHNFSIAGFTLRGFEQHGLHLACVNGFSITNNVAENNGVYGLFPVVSQHGFMAGNVVRGTLSDAGIYVGQSDEVLMTGNIAENNLIGLEVENSQHCSVIANEISNNTLGLLVDVAFGLIKNAQQKTLVALNNVHDNNRPNTGQPGNIASALPPGTGVLLLGADATTVTLNNVVNNNSSGIAVASLCLALALVGQTCPSGLGVNPLPDGNQITGNRVQGNGKVPTGIPLLNALEADLVWDGAGTGNCWSNNIFGTSVPPPSLLPACR